MTLPGPESPISLAEALTADCEKCGAAAGHPCTYLADRLENSRLRRRNPGYAETVYKVRKGDPMPGFAHRERRVVIRQRRQQDIRREQRREYRERRLAGMAAPVAPEALAAARAMQAHAVAEHMQLRAWWGKFGDIIANADRNTR